MDLECKKIEEGLKKLLFDPRRSREQDELKTTASGKHPTSKYRSDYKTTKDQEYSEEYPPLDYDRDKRYSGHKRQPKYARESKQSFKTSSHDGHYQNVHEKYEEHSYGYAEERKSYGYQRRSQNVAYNQKPARRDSQTSYNKGENRNLKYSEVHENREKDSSSLSQSKYEDSYKQKSRYRNKKVKSKTVMNGLIKLEDKLDHSSDSSLKQISDNKKIGKLLTDMDERESDNLVYSNPNNEATKNTGSVNKNITPVNYDNNSSQQLIEDDNIRKTFDKREKRKKKEKKKDKNKVKDPSFESSVLKKQISNSDLQQMSSSQDREIKVKQDQEKDNTEHLPLDTEILKRFGNKEQEDLLRLEKEGFLILWKDSKIKFECKVCVYKCYELSIAIRHLNHREHQMKKQDQDYDAMLKVLPEPLSCQIESITELLLNIADQHGLSDSEMEARKLLVKFLNESFQKFLPGCEFELVGSSVSGFGLKTSEADIVLVIPSDGDAADLLASTYELLRKVHDFKNVSSEFTEKVPQIHFTVEATGLKCNITLNNSYSNITSKLLSDYASIDRRVQVLGIAFRFWAKICSVDQRKMGTLAPFCYPFLLIHFLQQRNPPVLPVLHELQSEVSSDADSYLDPKDLEGKWKCENHESIGNLWISLFKFYTVLFKFGEDVVNVCHLKPVTIKDKKWGTKFLAIEDFPNSKRNLANSIPNRQLFNYLTGCFKTTYNYFARPELSDGPLAFIQITVLEEEDINDFSQNPAMNCSADIENITDANKLFEMSKDFNNISSSQEKKLLDENVLSATSPDTEKLLTDLAEKSESLKDLMEETLEDQDPDLSINDVITTIKNISFDNASPVNDTDKDDAADESCSNVEDEEMCNIAVALEATSMNVKSDANSCSDNKGALECPETLSENELTEIYLPKITSINLLKEMLPLGSAMKKLKYVWNMEDKCPCKEDMFYMFSKKTFTKGMAVPLVCRHCQKSGHLKQNCPDLKLPFICPLPPMDPHFLKQLDVTCQDIMRDFCPGQIEVDTRNSVLKELEEAIQTYYPDAHLAMFGSYCNGFGFTNSDMDICLTFRNTANGEGLNHIEIIEDLAYRLKNHKIFWDILAITSAKVPIVKFKYRSLDLEGDISLYNTLAQYNTLMLRTYCLIDPRVQLLGYTIKYFAKVLDICDASKGSLSSYAYILMVIFYLQQVTPPVIPVLQELYEGEKPKVMIDGWNAWFLEDYKNISKIWNNQQKNHQSIGELWLGLLKFYTEEFDLQNFVISIRQKEPLLRFKKLWNTKEIAIEDPFDLSHNLGGGLSRKMNTYIMKAFIRGREVFGTPCPLSKQFPTYQDYLFNRDLLTQGELPPNDRGCRLCRRIGHIMRDCPRRRPNKREQNEDEPRKRPPRWRKQQEGLPARDHIPPRQRRQTEPPSLPNRSQIKNHHHSGTYSGNEAPSNASKPGTWSKPYTIQQQHKQLPVSSTNVHGLAHSYPNSAQNHIQPFTLSALSMQRVPQQQSTNQQQIWHQQQTGYGNIPLQQWNQQQSNTNPQVQQVYRRC